jgi:hypothetical protein
MFARAQIIVSPDSAGMSGEDDGFYLKDGMLQKDTSTRLPPASSLHSSNLALTWSQNNNINYFYSQLIIMVGSMIPVRISPEAQRGLILLSKTLQQLANGTDFGWKEAYASPTLSRHTTQY